MRPASALSCSSATFIGLTIPIDAILSRSVDYIARHRDCDASETLADLIHALQQGDDFNLADLFLLDEASRHLAFGLMHHTLLTGHLTPDMLADAEVRLWRRLQRRGRISGHSRNAD